MWKHANFSVKMCTPLCAYLSVVVNACSSQRCGAPLLVLSFCWLYWSHIWLHVSYINDLRVSAVYVYWGLLIRLLCLYELKHSCELINATWMIRPNSTEISFAICIIWTASKDLEFSRYVYFPKFNLLLEEV